MKKTPLIMAIMLMASFGAACGINYVIDPTIINKALFITNTTSTATITDTGKSILMTSPINSAGMIYTDPDILPIVPGSFNVTIVSKNTTSGGNAIYGAFIVNDTAAESLKVGTLVTNIRANSIIHIEKSSSPGADGFYCFGALSGSSVSTTILNHTYTRFIKEANDNHIHAYYSADNIRWDEHGGSPCNIPASALGMFKTQLLAAGVLNHGGISGGVLNVTEIDALSNISLTGTVHVKTGSGAPIENCVITNTATDTGSSPYYSPASLTSNSVGLTGSFTYYPTCAQVVTGYEYIGEITATCPGYPVKPDFMYYDSVTSGALKEITMVNVTQNATTYPVCFQASYTDNNGVFVNYVSGAQIFNAYISEASSKKDAYVSDGLGKVTIQIDPAKYYTISGYKIPDYPTEKKFYTDIFGGGLSDYFASSDCVPVIFKESDTPAAKNFNLNLVVQKNGLTAGCLYDLDLSLYKCSSMTECELRTVLFKSGIDQINTTACGETISFSGFSAKYLKIEVDKRNIPLEIVSKTIFVDLNSSKTVILYLSPDTRPQTCFKVVDYSNNALNVGNIKWSILDTSFGTSSLLDNGGPVTGQFCSFEAGKTQTVTVWNNASYLNKDFPAPSGGWIIGADNILKLPKTQTAGAVLWISGFVMNSSGSLIDGVVTRATYGTRVEQPAFVEFLSVNGYYNLSGIPAGSFVRFWALGKSVGGVQYYDSPQSEIIALYSNLSNQNLTMNAYQGMAQRRTITIYSYYQVGLGSVLTQRGSLCDVNIELSCPGAPTLSGITKTTEDGLCSVQFNNAKLGCSYEVYGRKDSFTPDRHPLKDDMDSVLLSPSVRLGQNACQVLGIVSIENGTVSQPLEGVRINLLKDSSIMGSTFSMTSGNYVYPDALDCDTEYELNAVFSGKTVSQRFRTLDGSEGRTVSRIDLSIRLDDLRTQNAVSSFYDTMLMMSPMFTLIGLLLLFVILNMLLEAI